MKHKLLAGVMLIGLGFAGFSAKAQNNSSVTGVVTDATGAVVADAAVVLSNTSTGVSYTAKTDSKGSYRFPNVPPASTYTMRFEHAGFSAVTVDNVALAVANVRTQDATLNAGATQQVEVSAGSRGITINTTDASIGNNFSPSLVNELPIQDRSSVGSLFALQPGVAASSVTGARTDQTSVTVDGMDVNDIAAGNGLAGIVAGAPVDSVQEFRGTVAGLPPNLGTGSGGQFQLVTKSGTNKFHGLLYEYHRDTVTTANQYFNKIASLPRTPLIQNQFGGNIGGPILHDKLFFFFDFNNSRIIQSAQGTRTVPLDSYRAGNIGYILKTDAAGNACSFTSRRDTTPQCIATLTPAQVAALDPQGKGFDPALQTFINTRYPHANDLTGGDGINTGSYRFTQPTPDTRYNYVARLDYNLTSKQQIFIRGTIQRRDAIQSLNQLPTDPVTNPFIDRSYGYVVSHLWQLGNNKVNQFYFGDTISKFNFPSSYNPTGTTQFGFGGLSGPYNSGSSQKRRVPIPEFRDDFNWTLGAHNLGFGGTFKFIKTNSNLVNDFNFVTIGLGGSNLTLDSTVRPANIRGGSTAPSLYDSAFAFALGRIAAIGSNYNYNNAGQALTQGGGAVRGYRYYQTELYAGDTWKVTPELTLTYGLRWQLYTVPYETHGSESVQNTTFNQYFAARTAQSSAGNSGPASVPFITYQLGGKANNGPNLYAPSYKDFAPRFGFAYAPAGRHMVVNGSAALVYDRTVINAVNFIQDQSSYLFQNSANRQYGAATARAALLADPRLGANLSIPAPPTAPAISKPYTPFVDDAAGSATGTPNAPYGLAGNEFNTIVDPTLKDPYSITYNAGIQQEFPGNMILKLSYAGRLGRRLLAQADASQLIDFPDKASGQSLGQAFGTLTRQTRAGGNYTAQPWFENQVGRGSTVFLANALSTLVYNGDFADFVQALAANGYIDYNVGMASQFAENTYVTNRGFSSYNGLLATLSKSFSKNVQFDFNYTLSHSIDNVSANANYIAASSGVNFLCDALRPRECRGNSDFDVQNVINSDFIARLPVGRGEHFLSSAPFLLNELIGGWSLSGTPSWQSGFTYGTVSNAYVAGYAENAPAIFSGNRGAVQAHVHKTASGQVQVFTDPVLAQAQFQGPIGFTVGSRNNLRGPSQFNMNAGLAKVFPIYKEAVNLKFRADFFNVLNHPNFSGPNTDITSGTFGQITSTSNTARIGQFALRLEF